jgi:hypothetical protein
MANGPLPSFSAEPGLTLQTQRLEDSPLGFPVVGSFPGAHGVIVEAAPSRRPGRGCATRRDGISER